MKPQPPVKASGVSPVITTFLLLAGIPVFLGLALMVSGCELSFGGTYFTYSGEKVELSESGEFAEGVYEVHVLNKYGNVTITEGDQPGWSWSLTTWGDDIETAQQYSDLTSLEVTEVDGVQSMKLELPGELQDCNGIKSHLTLTVPDSMAAQVNNSHGDTSITGVEAGLTIDNAHGDLEIISSGDAVIASRHGNITINGIGSASVNSRHGHVTMSDATGAVEFEGQHGHFELHNAAALAVSNAHGDIEATGIAGDAYVEGRHGDIDVKCSGESIVASNAHGDISFTVESMNLKNVEIENAHGDINLRLPEEMLVKVNATTTHGDVYNQFDQQEDADVAIVLQTTFDDIHVKKHTVTVPVTESTSRSSE